MDIQRNSRPARAWLALSLGLLLVATPALADTGSADDAPAQPGPAAADPLATLLLKAQQQIAEGHGLVPLHNSALDTWQRVIPLAFPITPSAIAAMRSFAATARVRADEETKLGRDEMSNAFKLFARLAENYVARAAFAAADTDTQPPPPVQPSTPALATLAAALATARSFHEPDQADAQPQAPVDTSMLVAAAAPAPPSADVQTPVPTDAQTAVPVEAQTSVPVEAQTTAVADAQTVAPVEAQTSAVADAQTSVPVDAQTPVPVDAQTPVPVDAQTPPPAAVQPPVMVASQPPASAAAQTDAPVAPAPTIKQVLALVDAPAPVLDQTPRPIVGRTSVPADAPASAPVVDRLPVLAASQPPAPAVAARPAARDDTARAIDTTSADPPASRSPLALSLTAPLVASPSATVTVLPATTPQQDPLMAAIYLKRGDSMLAVKDITAARRFYEFAANAGSARGAEALAQSYDPDWLRETGAIGLQPDPALAAHWHGRAQELGDHDTGIHLDKVRLQAAQ